jgi:hypothetical protein
MVATGVRHKKRGTQLAASPKDSFSAEVSQAEFNILTVKKKGK